MSPEEKNCPSLAATVDQSIDLSVKMARKLIIIVPSSSNSNSNLICKEVRINLMETLSDQKDLQVEAKVIEEISDLELGDIICIVALDEAVSNAIKINEWCISKNLNFIWAHVNSEVMSLFCQPNPKLVASFKGQNSRPDNDLLLTEQFAKNDSGMWEITCTKKHYFQVGFVIEVQNADGNSIIECDVKQIVSDKIFCLKASEDAAEFQPDCDKTYVVKIARRDQSESNYMPLKESLNSLSPFLADPRDSELKILHEKFLSCHKIVLNQSKLGDTIFNEEFSSLLGKMIGCEVVSSMLLQNRLPLHQWVRIFLF